MTLEGQKRSQAKLRLPCVKFGLARQDFEVLVVDLHELEASSCYWRYSD